MRALLDLLAPDRDAAVPVGGRLTLAEGFGAVRVAALADRQIGALLAERHGAVERGELGRRHHVAPLRTRPLTILGQPAQHPIELRDVLGRRAAATTDDRDAVLGDEALEPGGEIARPERVAGPAVDQLGQTGIRLDGDRPRPALAEVGEVLGHLLRAGRAVEPDDRHIERADDRGRGRDVGADQHRAGGLDRDLNDERHGSAGRAHRGARAVDRRLGLERVLAGLAEDYLGAPRQQAGRLDGERLL